MVAGDQCSAPNLRCVGLVHHVRERSWPEVFVDVKYRQFLELTLCPKVKSMSTGKFYLITVCVQKLMSTSLRIKLAKPNSVFAHQLK